MMFSNVKKLLPLVASLVMMTVSLQTARADEDSDPIEPFNRAMFSFNYAADTYFIRPIAVGYRYITPQVFRTHLGNVTDNLYEPLNFVNSVLQGDFSQSAVSFWRFVINSTVGIAGINDVATEAGLPVRREDFGQTLAVWGVGSGPYIVLPIFGPSNARDTVGLIGDWYTNPVTYYVDTGVNVGIGATSMLVRREKMIESIDEIYESSLDPYISFRTIYLQYRKAQIENRYSDNKVSPTTR